MYIRWVVVAQMWVMTHVCLAQSSSPGVDVSKISHLEWALEFRELLQSVPGEQIICDALAAEFEAMVPESSHACRVNVLNRAKSAIFRVNPQGIIGTYEITLLAKSTELVLKNPNWCERHRLTVMFGYDTNIYPSITVLDFEPTVRTTSALLPEALELLEYIRLERDQDIRDLQDRIRNAVITSLYNRVNAARAARPGK